MASQRISDGQGGLIQVSSSIIRQRPTTWRVYISPNDVPITPNRTWCTDVRTVHEGDAVDEALRQYGEQDDMGPRDAQRREEIRQAADALPETQITRRERSIVDEIIKACE